MTGVGGSQGGRPGKANVKLTLPSVEVDTLAMEAIPVVEAVTFEGRAGRLQTSDARTTTFSRTSTPAASKTSTIGT